MIVRTHNYPRRFPVRMREHGNIFFALFGAVALLGVLGVTVATFIKGPLSSSIKVTRMNVAESQMAVMAQAITMQSSVSTNCDPDTFVEPLPWQPAGGLPHPINGGLLPAKASVASNKDPWGTAYGYCSWDHGANSCGSSERLRGAVTNANGQTVIAIISAGPDKKFTTTCRSFAAADVNGNGQLGDPGDLLLVSKAAPTDDDVIFAYTYREAAGAAGGLWTLKSSDEEVAAIDKGLEISGSGSFQGAGTFDTLVADIFTPRSNSFIDILDGLQLPDLLAYNPACTSGTEGVVRKNGSSIEMCASGGWISVTLASGSAAPLPEDATTVCDNTKVGAVRYEPDLGLPQFCNGTSWRSLIIQKPKAHLVISPTLFRTTATGPCTSDCPRAHSAQQVITITNIGSAPSTTIDFFGYTGLHVVPGATSCGAPLAPGANCQITFTASATANGTKEVGFVIVDNASSPSVVYQYGYVVNSATGFACVAGQPGWGGLVVSCANSTTPNYVLNYAGCSGGTYEPQCGGSGVNDFEATHGLGFLKPENMTSTSGAQNAVNWPGYRVSSMAMSYCDNLVQDGYDDWFLPSLSEWQTIIYPQRASLNFNTGPAPYWTSNYSSTGNSGIQFNFYTPSTNASGQEYGEILAQVRCLRRHGVAFPAIVSDSSPKLASRRNALTGDSDLASGNLGYSYAWALGQRVSSDPYTVRSINTGVTLNVSGGTNTTISINGGVPTTSGTIYNGDNIIISTDAPAVGNESAIALSPVGPYIWRVRTPASNIYRVFASTSLYNANLGGVTGADSKCQAEATAQGLSGTWVALLGVASARIESRVPWNWNRLENMAGEVIAKNMGQLFYLQDSASVSPAGLSASIRYLRNGTLVPNDTMVWTGLASGLEGVLQADLAATCQSWTLGAAGTNGATGNPYSTSKHWGSTSSASCNSTLRLYCIGGPF